MPLSRTKISADEIVLESGVVMQVADISGGGEFGNIDGGSPDSEYGGSITIDGGDVNGN